MHMEHLLEILEKTPLEEGRSAAILAADLYKEIAPYLEKGIATEQEELDFCGMVDVALDEGGLTDQKRARRGNQSNLQRSRFPASLKG